VALSLGPQEDEGRERAYERASGRRWPLPSEGEGVVNFLPEYTAAHTRRQQKFVNITKLIILTGLDSQYVVRNPQRRQKIYSSSLLKTKAGGLYFKQLELYRTPLMFKIEV
jgi:hypothetical protein